MNRLAFFLSLLLPACSLFHHRPSEPDCPPPPVSWPSLHPLLSPGLGVEIFPHQLTGNDRALLAQLKPALLRIPLGWSYTWPGPGNWGPTDAALDVAESIGARLVLILDYRHPDGGWPWESEEAVAEWEQLLRDAAARYAGRPVIFEVWNEPNFAGFWPPDGADPSQYWRFAIHAAREIRNVDPFACIVAPALAGIDLDWFEAPEVAEAVALFDAFSVHPYRKESPATFADDVREIECRLKEKAGMRAPLIVSEWGYADREEAARYLPEAWAACREAGVPVLVWYQWRSGDGRFGLLNDSFEKQPAWAAFVEAVDARDRKENGEGGE